MEKGSSMGVKLDEENTLCRWSGGVGGGRTRRKFCGSKDSRFFRKPNIYEWWSSKKPWDGSRKYGTKNGIRI